MLQTIKTLLKPLASLKLTVVLLALSIVLVLAGTLAQVDMGIWDVVHGYFRSFRVYIPLQIFFPRSYEIRGEVPFPGGYTIGAAMLVNLLTAHVLRFKVKARGGGLAGGLVLTMAGGLLVAWFHNSPIPGEILAFGGGYPGVLPLMVLGSVVYSPLVVGCVIVFGRRGGIILIHSALILLLVGEVVTAVTAIETQMPIYEGMTAHWSHDIREVELAVIDPSDPDHDVTTVVPQSVLRRAATDRRANALPGLPISITVDRYLGNSQLMPLTPGGGRLKAEATHGFGVNYSAGPARTVSGVDPDRMINVPAALVTFSHGQEPIGRYLVSPHFQTDAHIVTGQRLVAGGKAYMIYLRFKRYYKPYSMHLIKFHHDVYPGTSIPRNFSSEIRLVDPVRSIDREINIRMNSPLRYGGETYFQSSWIPGANEGEPDRGTVLMAVRNPGWTIPYIACALGSIGLVFQFGSNLIRFLRRQTL